MVNVVAVLTTAFSICLAAEKIITFLRQKRELIINSADFLLIGIEPGALLPKSLAQLRTYTSTRAATVGEGKLRLVVGPALWRLVRSSEVDYIVTKKDTNERMRSDASPFWEALMNSVKA